MGAAERDTALKNWGQEDLWGVRRGEKKSRHLGENCEWYVQEIEGVVAGTQ